MIARDDQREVNNLPMLHEDQQQGRMLVIDEAKAAHELVAVAKMLAEDERLGKIRKHLLDIQDFVFRHRGTKNPEVTGKEIDDLKWSVQKALDHT